MRPEGIRGASRSKRRFTTHSDPAAPRAPDLLRRDFTATRPNHKWVADFTYCSTWSGVVYVAFVIEVFSRRIVGWKASRSMTAALVVDALNMAAWVRRGVELDGLICHSDAGGQGDVTEQQHRLFDPQPVGQRRRLQLAAHQRPQPRTGGPWIQAQHPHPAAIRSS
jgi:hypothetical protein